ncbi:hypothetical protein EZV62_001781 [Acer yangbiense]|uniref:Bromo domain-containing protein n=1 Tax=Acer yangbiense TaxID=1000413 RepID=A0A5C7IXC5_9ROSI|nr:hypothetical protein EZV62_001781 [Acer yangbiense]
MLKICVQILTKLMKHKHGYIFNSPVDVVGMGLHDYYDIIKNPMDLGTVKSKLNKILYDSPADFAADVRLTFKNAMTYNPEGHDAYVIGEQLLIRFEELFHDHPDPSPIHIRRHYKVRGIRSDGRNSSEDPTVTDACMKGEEIRGCTDVKKNEESEGLLKVFAWKVETR